MSEVPEQPGKVNELSNMIQAFEEMVMHVNTIEAKYNASITLLDKMNAEKLEYDRNSSIKQQTYQQNGNQQNFFTELSAKCGINAKHLREMYPLVVTNLVQEEDKQESLLKKKVELENQFAKLHHQQKENYEKQIAIWESIDYAAKYRKILEANYLLKVTKDNLKQETIESKQVLNECDNEILALSRDDLPWPMFCIQLSEMSLKNMQMSRDIKIAMAKISQYHSKLNEKNKATHEKISIDVTKQPSTPTSNLVPSNKHIRRSILDSVENVTSPKRQHSPMANTMKRQAVEQQSPKISTPNVCTPKSTPSSLEKMDKIDKSKSIEKARNINQRAANKLASPSSHFTAHNTLDELNFVPQTTSTLDELNFSPLVTSTKSPEIESSNENFDMDANESGGTNFLRKIMQNNTNENDAPNDGTNFMNAFQPSGDATQSFIAADNSAGSNNGGGNFFNFFGNLGAAEKSPSASNDGFAFSFNVNDKSQSDSESGFKGMFGF